MVHLAFGKMVKASKGGVLAALALMKFSPSARTEAMVALRATIA